ncbi:MAG: type transport system permease protein [Chloroflexota bacterium]|nr:type transport system permease protein [Chloroflexota bacterium]
MTVLPGAGRRRSAIGFRRNALLIARREYLDRVPTRTFLAATVVLAVVAVGLALAPIALRHLERETVVRIGIVAPDDNVAKASLSLLDGYLNAPPQGVDPATWQKPFALVEEPDQATAMSGLSQRRLTSVLVIERGTDGGLSFTFHTPESAASAVAQRVGFGSVGVGILDWQAQLPSNSGVGQFHPPAYAVVSSDPAAPSGPSFDPQLIANRSILATVLIVLIFVTLTVYGMWVATSVAAEKSTRVMELLISAATPRELLVGKVVGVGGAGLTQYAGIIIPAALVVLFQDRIAGLLLSPAPTGGEAPLDGLTLPILAAFLLFFILGFLLYALLYAAAGSLVSRQEDVQQLALPLSLVSMASYIAAAIGLSSIGSPLVVVLSFVPFSSPFVMLARVMLGRVEPWEIALSVAILVGTSGLILVLASRIYATGVLLYGQRPGVLAFLRAARTAIG